MSNHDYLQSETPCIGFVAKSGTGKTSLLEKVIRHLHTIGMRIAVIKHTHHDFEIDIPGKDSYRLRHAGAQQTLISGPNRWALIHEKQNHRPASDPTAQNSATESESLLHNAVAQLNHDSLDCVLIEGFKTSNYPKIELHRAELNQANLYPEDSSIIAIASNSRSLTGCSLPILDIDDTKNVCQFIMNTINFKSSL